MRAGQLSAEADLEARLFLSFLMMDFLSSFVHFLGDRGVTPNASGAVTPHGVRWIQKMLCGSIGGSGIRCAAGAARFAPSLDRDCTKLAVLVEGFRVPFGSRLGSTFC